MTSKFRAVQKSSNGLGCLIYLQGPGVDRDGDRVGDLDEAIAAALPGVGIASTADSGLSAGADDLEAARKLVGAERIDGLVGFSAGCQGVRNHLYRGVRPRVVCAIDGAHGEWPQLSAAQQNLWSELGADARAGRSHLIMTCTAQRYVQGSGVKPRPYAATSTVIARTQGRPEFETYKAERKPLASYPGVPVVEHHDGGLHLLGYPGTDCDGPAHAAQLTLVLPMMLSTHVAPALGLGAGAGLGELMGPLWRLGEDLADFLTRAAAHATETTPADAGPSDLAELHLQRAIAELGQTEIPGPPSNKRIDAYLATCIRAGKVIGLRGDDQFSWCAAFVGWSGLPRGLVSRAAVWELCADARREGLLRLPGSGYEPRPGDLAIYERAGQNPLKPGQLGHVNRVRALTSSTVRTIGGNESDPARPGLPSAVRESERRKADVIAWISYEPAA